MTALQEAATGRIAEAHRNVKGGGTSPPSWIDAARALAGQDEEMPQTGVEREQAAALGRRVVARPRRSSRSTRSCVAQFERRASALADEGEVDWGLAEGLAFASLLADGTPMRLTGQDTERGTFSHRHAVLHDAQNGAKYVPLQHLADARASFEMYNSPLSEYACLGFEYGYSTVLTEALVLWEAQFGDFYNGAQIIIDQFIAAGRGEMGPDLTPDAAAAARL